MILGGSGKTRDDLVDLVAICRRNIRIIQAKGYRVYGQEREGILDEMFKLPRFPGVSRELWCWDKKAKEYLVDHV